MAFTAGNLSVHSKHPYRPHLGLGISHGFETEICFANMIGCIEAGAWRDLEIETLSSKMEALKVLKVQDFGNLSCHFFCPLPDSVRVPFMEDPKTGLVNSFLLNAIRKHLCSTSKRSPVVPSWQRFWRPDQLRYGKRYAFSFNVTWQIFWE